MYFSETVQSESDKFFDFRGDILNDDKSCAQFSTINTPNAGLDITSCTEPNPPYCIHGWSPQTRLSARSRHPGGVEVSMGDASIRFVANGIDLITWKALGSMQGEEVTNTE